MIRTLAFSALAALALSAADAQSPRAVRSRDALAPDLGTQATASQTVVVERVLDGDTVIVRGLQERVRLANVDAPEMSHGYGKPGQPFSAAAGKWLTRKVAGKAVTLRCPDHDRYGRLVCDVFIGGEYVNRELVRAGLAWANTAQPRYLRDQTVLVAQHEAQQAHRGLWADRAPTPPWSWRHACWKDRVCESVPPAKP